MQEEIIDHAEAPKPVDAATVVVIRNSAASGLEALMLQRNNRGPFGGMWVFPGGQVDEADRKDSPADDVVGECEPPHGPEDPPPPSHRGFRTAAIREAAEEASIDLASTKLAHLSHWLPPPIRPKRFATHFFVCEAPADMGDIVVDQSEIVDHTWVAPEEALRRRNLGEIEFVTPTFVTLSFLAKHDSAEAVLAELETHQARCFHTEMIQGPAEDPGLVAVYPGDAAYPDGDLDAAGPRRRCYMLQSAWTWEERP